MTKKVILDTLTSILKDFYPHYLMPHPTTRNWPSKNQIYISIFTQQLGNLADQLLCSGGYPTCLVSCRSMNHWSNTMTRNVYALTLSDWKSEQERHDETVANNPHLEIDPIRPANPDTKRFDRLNVHPWRRPSLHEPLMCMIDENQDDLQMQQETPPFICIRQLSGTC